MIKDGENLYIGTNEVPDEVTNKELCVCEHLKIQIDFGLPYDHEDNCIPKCNILKEKFLFFFKVKKRCPYFESRNFHCCNLYAPATARGTI